MGKPFNPAKHPRGDDESNTGRFAPRYVSDAGDGASALGDVLTRAQRLVARAFFALPESEGFYVPGGAALAESSLTARPTEDIDLFAPTPSADIAAQALVRRCQALGWQATMTRSSGTFARVVIDTRRAQRSSS